MNLGLGELLLIAAVVLLLFGAKRLPELGRSLGDAIREFQRASRGDEKSDKKTEDKT